MTLPFSVRISVRGMSSQLLESSGAKVQGRAAETDPPAHNLEECVSRAPQPWRRGVRCSPLPFTLTHPADCPPAVCDAEPECSSCVLGAEDMNKKQQDRAKSSMVVDKTFGMKNKNKSKKVQKYIANVKNAADNRFTDRKEEKAKKEAMSRKEAKKAHEAEMAALFNAVPEKPKKKDKFAQDEAAPAEESVDDTAAFLEQMGISVPQADGRRKQARARRDA